MVGFPYPGSGPLHRRTGQQLVSTLPGLHRQIGRLYSAGRQVHTDQPAGCFRAAASNVSYMPSSRLRRRGRGRPAVRGPARALDPLQAAGLAAGNGLRTGLQNPQMAHKVLDPRGTPQVSHKLTALFGIRRHN
jgi:hypothetical protein